MLSYRHAFHAGNFADVLKHSVLHYVLNYMTEKEKGFSYIDTHSGAGMYKLQDEYAQKTGEYKQGIGKLYKAPKLTPLLADYVELIKSFNTRALAFYPGSPAVAQYHARKQDSARLFELHNTDISLLEQFCDHWKQASVFQKDGYAGLVRQLPPPTRRAVVLIDPPFEIKNDYQKAVDAVIKAHKKFATGTYIIWYPVVQRHYIDTMEAAITNSQLSNVMKVELCLSPDSEQYGMTGTGLFIVNPPWQLASELENALPQLKTLLGTEQSGYTLEMLVPE